MKSIRILIISFASLAILWANPVVAQGSLKEFTADSVNLEMVVRTVLATHPTVLKAQEAVNAAEAGIGMAKSTWYPTVDFGATYTRIGPVPSITIPNMGTFEMAPANNFSSSFNVYQSIYDFSKTEKSVNVAEASKEIVEKNIDLVKQKLALLCIGNYYSIAYLQEAIRIKDLQLGILEKHLDFITRKKETGSATDYEILATNVRISGAKNQKLDLETALENQLTVLNSLLGFPATTRIRVKNQISIQPALVQADSLVSFALNNRNEISLAKMRQKQAELKLQSIKIENYPMLGFFASAGMKNGYFPETSQIKPNYAAGLGLKIPIYTATRHSHQLQIASSDINSIKQDIEINQREISSEVLQNIANLKSSRRKIEQSELQLQQAEEARKLADLSYKAGTLTNLDLLDSESLEAESRLNLMKAQIDYKVNLSKLEISLGKQGF